MNVQLLIILAINNDNSKCSCRFMGMDFIEL